MQKKIFVWRFRMSLFSVHSLSLYLSLPAPTTSWLPFKSNSDFHFPMPLVMNHGLGFQDSTRLHFSKSKSDFPFSSLLGSDSRLKHSQPSSLSLSLSLSLSPLINWSFLSVLRSLCSLVSLVISKSLFFHFFIIIFYFETNKALYSFTSKSF